jgi:hypothetical protein
MHMIQGPTPLPGLDPNFLLNQLIPLVGGIAALIAGTLVLRWLFHSPIGEAIAEGIRLRRRRRWGEVTREAGAADAHRVGALEEQVLQLQGQISELAERLDFAERVLAERRERKLGAGQ